MLPEEADGRLGGQGRAPRPGEGGVETNGDGARTAQAQQHNSPAGCIPRECRRLSPERASREIRERAESIKVGERF